MRKTVLHFGLLLAVLASVIVGALSVGYRPVAGAIAAFPGAEGFGALAVGGRGGRVFIVSNLNDAGSGSLRECVSASGPRTCVFNVAGRIVLASPLLIDNPFITIAGQTAPGNGITLSAGPSITRGIVIVRTHDVILRYLGLRPGLNANQVLVENEYNIDALTIGDVNREPYNVIVDHVSMAWATDEILNTARKHHSLTIQWSILSEVNDCDGNPTNNKCGGKGPLFHTGTGAQRGGGDISFHHNLLSSNQGRNPMIKNSGGVIDVVNNVIFPTTRPDGTAITTILDSTHGDINLNFVGNSIIGDPLRLNDPRYVDYLGLRMAYPNVAGRVGRYQVYVRGNIGPMRPSDTCPGLSQKDCELLIINPVHVDQRSWNQRGAENLHLNGQGNLIPHLAPQVTTHSAADAYAAVMAQAGKSARLTADGTWVTYHDSIDAKIIADVANRRPVQISGQPWPPSASAWPAGTTVAPYPDVDRDGMSDVWETRYFGNLARGSAANSASDYDNDGYTDLEEFLNGTNPVSAGQAPAATATQVSASSTPAPTNTQAPRQPTATRVPPTQIPPTWTPTYLAPTMVATNVPPTFAPTSVPPTAVPPTALPTEAPPTAVPNEPAPGFIWGDGFESGGLSAWTSAETDGGDLSATNAAALDGSFGLQVVLNDRKPLYVADESPQAEAHYRARFAFDPNSIQMGRGNVHAVFQAFTASEVVVRLELRRQGSSYQVRPALRDDGGRWQNGQWINIADAPQQLELDWRAATTNGARDGSLILRIDGAEAAHLNGVDNDQQRLESVRLGALDVKESETRGSYFIDQFESER